MARTRPHPVVYVVLALVVALGVAVAGFSAYRLVTGNAEQTIPVSPTSPSPPATASGSPASRSSADRRPPGLGVDGGTRRALLSELDGVVRLVVLRPDPTKGSAGTGMVLTSGGLVVTNRHVVAGGRIIRAILPRTGHTYDARLVGSDRRTDVAVLRLVGAHGLSPVRPDRSRWRVGQKVVVVGDAGGGSGSLTAAPGRVRSLDRRFVAPPADGQPGETLRGVAEVTSDVARGDSGGPTYDLSGHVVGMTTGKIVVGGHVGGISVPIADVLGAVARIDGR